MAIKVYAEAGKLNHIGRVGENKAEILVFDVSKIINNFGTDGNFSLLISQKGDLFTETTNISKDINNKTVEWIITSQYTTNINRGKCQLVYTIGEVIIKSEVYDIIVTEAY